MAVVARPRAAIVPHHARNHAYTATVHAGREVVGDHRFIEEPLYHLKLVARSVAERVATVEQYEREAPGLRTDRGWAVNGAYYLPEERPVQPRTTPIPAADARTRSTPSSRPCIPPCPAGVPLVRWRW